MNHAPRPKPPTGARPAAATAAPAPVAAARRRGGGFFLLPFIPEKPAIPPATNATWAWSLRRFARYAVWLLPGYAVWIGVLSLASADGANLGAYLANDRPLHVVGWVAGVWLGLLALMALTGLLVVARTRRTALVGLLVALGGTLLMLPFAAVSEQSPAYGADARVLAVLGAAGYSVGWMLTGWAVIRSGVFNFGDGLLLMLAGPLVGAIGLYSDPMQTLGAIFILTAGIGIAWRAGRLVPMVRPGATSSPAGPLLPETGAGGPLPAPNPAAP